MNPDTSTPKWYDDSGPYNNEIQALEAIFCAAYTAEDSDLSTVDDKSRYLAYKASCVGATIAFVYHPMYDPNKAYREQTCIKYLRSIRLLGPDRWMEALRNHLSTATSIAPSASIFIPSLVW
jgi:hypothetical protein